jgi:hypothetical protein
VKTLWDPGRQEELLQRVGRLTPDSRARWGRMTCPQMVVHITDAFALYLGELRAAGKRTPLQYAPLKHAFVYVVPIPRNVPTAPELTARLPCEWADEITRLRGAITRFAGERARRDWPLHPIFGRLSPRAYGVLAYKHTDHHLRQFGV